MPVGERSSDMPEREALLLARPERIAAQSHPTAGTSPLGLEGGRDGLLSIPPGLTPEVTVPLLVALHGAGGAASQMIDLLRKAADRAGIVLLSPESRGPTWDVIRGAYGPDVAFIDRALRSVFDLVAIDPLRIAIAGFSDGASYALSLGIPNGNLFSDILAFSPGFMAPPGQAGTPKVFISHGTEDDVLPIDRCSRRLAPALRRAGYDLEYREFVGGHVVPEDMIAAGIARFLA